VKAVVDTDAINPSFIAEANLLLDCSDVLIIKIYSLTYAYTYLFLLRLLDLFIGVEIDTEVSP